MTTHAASLDSVEPLRKPLAILAWITLALALLGGGLSLYNQQQVTKQVRHIENWSAAEIRGLKHTRQSIETHEDMRQLMHQQAIASASTLRSLEKIGLPDEVRAAYEAHLAALHAEGEALSRIDLSRLRR